MSDKFHSNSEQQWLKPSQRVKIVNSYQEYKIRKHTQVAPWSVLVHAFGKLRREPRGTAKWMIETVTSSERRSSIPGGEKTMSHFPFRGSPTTQVSEIPVQKYTLRTTMSRRSECTNPMRVCDNMVGLIWPILAGDPSFCFIKQPTRSEVRSANNNSFARI